MAKFAASFSHIDCPQCGDPIPLRYNAKFADEQPTPGLLVLDVSIDEPSVKAMEIHLRGHLQ